MAGGGLSGGTGQKLTQATIIVAGVASLLASLLSIVLVASRILISFANVQSTVLCGFRRNASLPHETYHGD